MPSFIESYRQREQHRVVGLMSGTSLDGVDVACVKLRGSGESIDAELEHFQCIPFISDHKKSLISISGGSYDIREVAQLDFELGEFFAAAILEMLDDAGLASEQVDLIGSHGQTIVHLPRGTEFRATRATLQIGEPCVIAERTGITTVSDFRPRDIAADGEGAPLIPYVDYCLLRHPTKHRIVQNIGGIANCTVLPAGCSPDEVRAWDTGPGNMVIDQCVRICSDGHEECDWEGAIASTGKVDEAWLAELLRHSFFRQSPPKSAGREEFGYDYAYPFVKEGRFRRLGDEDIIATATALTAASIADSYRKFAVPLFANSNAPTEVILGGGGVFNPTLRRMLTERLAPWQVLTHEDCGLRSDAKEAIGFAILAHETMMGVATNVPGATGASRRAVLGKIVPGRAW
jgi:anhydro-N-acetylmuramic acid kinase